MNELRILYIVLFFSALSWGQKEKVSEPSYVDIRYNYTYYNLTYLLEKPGRIGRNLGINKGLEYPYIIHLKDTTVILSNVQFNSKETPYVIQGSVGQVSNSFHNAYNLVLPTVANDSCSRCVYNFVNEYYPYVGQIHLFLDNSIELDNSSLFIKEEDIVKYTMFKTLKEKERKNMSPERRKMNKVRLAIGITVPTVFTIAGAIILGTNYD